MVVREPLRREQIVVLAILAVLTAAAWAITLSQMGGMSEMGMSPPAGSSDMASGEAMGMAEVGPRLFIFLGTWVVMMAAMMLPSAAPMILLFGTVHRRQRQRGGAFVPTWVFVAGYLGIWTAFGVYAFGSSLLAAGLGESNPWLANLSPRLAALAMLAAGLYQLTPLKRRCLTHCRSPLHFIMEHWRPGTVGALRMGVEHGLYCVGCCWVLFVVLVAVGLSSLPWMGLIALIIFGEKLLPRGRLVSSAVSAGLLAFGLLTLLRPDLLAMTMG